MITEPLIEELIAHLDNKALLVLRRVNKRFKYRTFLLIPGLNLDEDQSLVVYEKIKNGDDMFRTIHTLNLWGCNEVTDEGLKYLAGMTTFTH